MLIPMPRILCLRPSSGSVVAATFLNAGATASCVLPTLALGRTNPACKASAFSASFCVCHIQIPTQSFSNPRHSYVQHGPSVRASAASSRLSCPSSSPAPPAQPHPRPRMRHPPPTPASFLSATPSPSSFTSPSISPAFINGPLRYVSSPAAASSSHTSKRRRTAAAASPVGQDDLSSSIKTASAAATDIMAPSNPSQRHLDDISSSTSAVPTAAATAFTDRSPSYPALTGGLGQVIASASNYVRVEMYQVLPDQELTPQHWRPPHLRPQTAPAAAATASGELLPRPRRLLCSVRSLLRKLGQDVLVGDIVRVGSVDWREGRGVVSEVLPRSSRLVDPSVANVDHVLLVFALDQPPFEELQVSRFLVAAEAAGLPFRLVLNKADLVGAEELSRRMEQCRSWGYEPLVLSCERGQGVEQVASVLQGRISVVAGPSGAGKSSLINFLRLGRHRPDLQASHTGTMMPGADAAVSLPAGDNVMELVQLPSAIVQAYGPHDASCSTDEIEEVEVTDGEEGDDGEQVPQWRRKGQGGGGAASAADATGDAPEFLAVGSLSRIGRGMHTTTAVTLLRLAGGGWLADTPGFGQPTLEDVQSSELARYFPEMATRSAAKPCRFSDCLHLSEPGCSVSAAGLERYPHYLRFLQEIKIREEGDVRQLQRAKAEREGTTKTKNVRGGGERQEARLDPRRHRRQSRQNAKRAGQREEEELLG
ncbi:hypothetical protein Vretimale_759 [Volvox reticuliferus]|uniref:Uncharacterized protein n=1 Tax=Volvox reticuliferus TaxID=1737510 RepID=A0A8J4FI50_9CHLO|nr:hypothetical protein Vretifemale_2274 [Volvox reticuliferus]GIL94527.1 hypothetical protein Vretimale_759 [Volvox reticuliferus]